MSTSLLDVFTALLLEPRPISGHGTQVNRQMAWLFLEVCCEGYILKRAGVCFLETREVHPTHRHSWHSIAGSRRECKEEAEA